MTKRFDADDCTLDFLSLTLGAICQVGHSFRDAKGQGRRKSSKVLQDLGDKVGSSHDAEVASLSEENRGAVALTVFKLGCTKSINKANGTAKFKRATLLCDTPLSEPSHDEYPGGKVQADMANEVAHAKISDTDLFRSAENNITRKLDEQARDIFNKRVGCTVIPTAVTKENNGFVVHIKNPNDATVDPAVAEDADEDVNAASSLLFLQRALGTRRAETGEVKSQEDERHKSEVLPANDTKHTAKPFHHSWAVPVPSESGGTKNIYYFL